MILFIKELLGISAIILTIAAFIPYIVSIWYERTKPHVFTWVIWGTTTFIVFLAQLFDKGGMGAWPMGISGIITFYVALLAYHKKSDRSISRSDWLFFSIAMAAIPCWYITSSPLSAVLLLTCIDIIGYLPTLSKARSKPFEEQLLLYVLMSLRNILAISALEHYSLTTLIFPVAKIIANIATILVIYRGRQRVRNRENSLP